MNEPVRMVIDDKQIALFRCEAEGAPIVYANMYMENGQDVLAACEVRGCRPFHLVSVSNLRWDEELSPWAHEPIVSKDDHFTGEARQYVKCMTERIIPRVEETVTPPSFRILAGYSMGGLFALYAPYLTEAFLGVTSASGSVWYPGFVSYAETHEFLKNPAAIYLSLGDTESHTKNRVFRQTEDCMHRLYSLYRQKSIHSIFGLNPGNHVRDAVDRLAKGIVWTLSSCS